jgi:hypothetical protein
MQQTDAAEAAGKQLMRQASYPGHSSVTVAAALCKSSQTGRLCKKAKA